MAQRTVDVAVLGGGIVGLATARELLLRGARRVAVLEREPAVAQHQTLRNSGVIHAGLYYAPGSHKARLCVSGMRLMYDYLQQKRIPHARGGKLVVATHAGELPALRALHKTAEANGVPDLRYVAGLADMRDVEPRVRGVAALHSPHTGVVDWHAVAASLADDVAARGGAVLLRHEATSLAETASGVRVECANGASVSAARVVACCGAHADRVAALSGGAAVRHPEILPVRGTYLWADARALPLRGSIYPVPGPAGAPGAAFLGVHLTPSACGAGVLLGPSAVPSLSRVARRRAVLRDAADQARSRAVWRLARRTAPLAFAEAARAAFPALAIARAKAYVEGLESADVRRAPERAGVRAQALDSDGGLVADFVFETSPGGRQLHVRNAPSPAATASLAIARVLADEVGKMRTG